MVRDELEREQDIEELRRLALAIEAQNRLLLAMLGRKSREVDQLRGKPGDIQLTLKMLEELKAKAKATQDAIERGATKKPTEKKPRASSGPTPQPNLPVVEREFTFDAPDRTCTSCGGDLRPMKDQFEASEMKALTSSRLVVVRSYCPETRGILGTMKEFFHSMGRNESRLS